MFVIENTQGTDKEEFYKKLNSNLTALISEEKDWLADTANASALLYLMMSDINWAGFYFYKSGELVLGPFQGKPACIRIALGRGVCGTAALTRSIQVIEDVHQFPGHIACDDASRSEIVLPIVKGDKLIGVLDIDSPDIARFDSKDAEGLTKFVDIMNQYIDWPELF